MPTGNGVPKVMVLNAEEVVKYLRSAAWWSRACALFIVVMTMAFVYMMTMVAKLAERSDKHEVGYARSVIQDSLDRVKDNKVRDALIKKYNIDPYGGDQ